MIRVASSHLPVPRFSPSPCLGVLGIALGCTDHKKEVSVLHKNLGGEFVLRNDLFQLELGTG